MPDPDDLDDDDLDPDDLEELPTVLDDEEEEEEEEEELVGFIAGDYAAGGDLMDDFLP